MMLVYSINDSNPFLVLKKQWYKMMYERIQASCMMWNDINGFKP